MLSAFDLSEMRGIVNSSLPDSAGIITRTMTADTRGGSTASWSAPTTVACRLAPLLLSPGERDQAGTELDIQNWMITLPANTTVHVTDRITIGARTFEVLIVNARRSWEIHTSVRCQEVL